MFLTVGCKVKLQLAGRSGLGVGGGILIIIPYPTSSWARSDCMVSIDYQWSGLI